MSIGNATSADGWAVTASNVRMQNGIGVLYGAIHKKTAAAPAWSDVIGKFPNFISRYWIPLTLFSMRGEIVLGAAVDSTGQIKLCNPDYSKITTEIEYHFFAVYSGKNL